MKSAVAVVEKPTFGSKDLPALLADYDEIELMGLCTDICVVSNALMLKAFYPEKTVSVVSSCCAYREIRQLTLSYFCMRMYFLLTDTKEL